MLVGLVRRRCLLQAQRHLARYGHRPDGVQRARHDRCAGPVFTIVNSDDPTTRSTSSTARGRTACLKSAPLATGCPATASAARASRLQCRRFPADATAFGHSGGTRRSGLTCQVRRLHHRHHAHERGLLHIRALWHVASRPHLPPGLRLVFRSDVQDDAGQPRRHVQRCPPARRARARSPRVDDRHRLPEAVGESARAPREEVNANYRKK